MITDNDKQRIEQEAKRFTEGWGENCDIKSFKAGAEYATRYEREQQAKESFDEYRKGCNFKCGNTPLEKNTCQCYNDWLQDKAERSELRNKVEQVAELTKENERLKGENDRIEGLENRIKRQAELIGRCIHPDRLPEELSRLRANEKELVEALRGIIVVAEYPYPLKTDEYERAKSLLSKFEVPNQ